MLEIAPEKVAHIIIKAREYDSQVVLEPGKGDEILPSRGPQRHPLAPEH